MSEVRRLSPKRKAELRAEMHEESELYDLARRLAEHVARPYDAPGGRYYRERDGLVAEARIAGLLDEERVKPLLEWFVCSECGPKVRADEDGCCATCGRDCAIANAKGITWRPELYEQEADDE